MGPECYQMPAVVRLNYDANGTPAEGPDQYPDYCWRYTPEVALDFIDVTLVVPREDQNGL